MVLIAGKVVGAKSPFTKPENVYVNVGFAAPYNFDLSSAVIVNVALVTFNVPFKYPIGTTFEN